MQPLPFDLEKALSEDYEVITRGLTVVPREDWHYFKNYKRPYVIFYTIGEAFNAVTLKGEMSKSGESHFDLFLIKKPKIRWVNIYEQHNTFSEYTVGGRVFNSEIEARSNAVEAKNYIKTISFEV